MKKLLFLTVVTGLCMSMNAQVKESIPMQKPPEEKKTDVLFAPTNVSGLRDYAPSKPKRKSTINYVPYKGMFADADGRVSNLAFAALDVGLLPDIYYTQGSLGALYLTNLFPDSLAFKFSRDLANTYTGKYFMSAATGFVFDPYSGSFDESYAKGLFEDASGVPYGYRLDTLWTYIDYRLPQGYNSSSPDTLRFYITYFNAYKADADSVNYFLATINLGGGGTAYAICPKFEYPATIPQKGVGPVIKDPLITMDYILTNKDSSRLDPGLIGQKLLCLPIPNGFEVPTEAVLGVVAKYLPAFNYNLNDTLELSTWNSSLPAGSQFISQSIRKNFLSIASWDYDNSTENFFFDTVGGNTFFMEDKAIRYQNPTNATETYCVDKTIYNPITPMRTAFWMSLSIDPCKYPVSIASSINTQGDLVLSIKNPFDTYTWNTGATTSSITAANQGTYWVRVTNADGCNSADTTIVLFETDSVCNNAQYDFHGRILPAPAAGTHANTVSPNTYKLELFGKPAPPNPTITRNGSIFTSSSTDNNQWYKDDNIIEDSTGQTIDWTQTGAGKYSVVVTYPNGCFAKTYIGIYSISGRVRNNTTNQGVGGVKIKYVINTVDSTIVTGYAGDYSFYIDEGRNVTIEGDTTDYIYAPPGNIAVCNNVRTNFTRDFRVTPKNTGITDITTSNSSIRIYPNPASTKLHVKFSSQETADYVIYNIMGQILQQGKLQKSSVIDVETLASGMYYLKIISEGTTTVKFVKE